MGTIAENIKAVKNELTQGVELCAVSKFHDADAIRQAYDAGQRCFGESRVQEFVRKIDLLPHDIAWHFIGHLQTNKVKQIIGKVSLIESVDTKRLLRVVDEESRKAGVVTRLLMQLHVAREETKFGFSVDELKEFFINREYESLAATHICGVMGMASNVDDEDRIREDFRLIYSTYKDIRERISPELRGFDIVSMGMSGDWRIAVEEGSTLVRIGSAIFGPRQY